MKDKNSLYHSVNSHIVTFLGLNDMENESYQISQNLLNYKKKEYTNESRIDSSNPELKITYSVRETASYGSTPTLSREESAISANNFKTVKKHSLKKLDSNTFVATREVRPSNQEKLLKHKLTFTGSKKDCKIDLQKP
jgi:hypothetical protein